MKNIVVCSDGTGNTAIKGRGTNVFKLFEAVDLNGHRTNPRLTPQVAIYDDGVGTETFKPLKVFAGATGYGLARNVRQLYKELVRVYDPGDQIFLFGFSRGAFTVRTLAGFISRCGLLDLSKFATARALEEAVGEAYSTYRRYYRTDLARLILGKPDTSKTAQFREDNCLPGAVPITFIGVWDTVDSVGTPFHITDFINLAIYRFKFPDNHLSGEVRRACHALAIDEARDAFSPVLWCQDERLEQVWFAGAHSNVGGGYPKQGMSLVALDWMMHEAGECGLRSLETDRQLYREHGNVDDKLYNPRAGVGMFYRWLPRNIAAICQAHDVTPKIHLSALERAAHGTEDYAPGNLPPNLEVVITPTRNPEKDAAACHRALAVQEVLRKAHPDQQPLLSRVRAAISMGRAAYYVYVIAGLATILAASVPDGADSRLNPLTWARSIGTLLYNAITLQFEPLLDSAKRLVTLPELSGSIAGALLVSWFLIVFSDRSMSATFSRFWHMVQPALRIALKNARRESGGDGPGAFAQGA
jgi:uncharacterized protein (DUF2235 family)